jgi:hypothetical protein
MDRAVPDHDVGAANHQVGRLHSSGSPRRWIDPGIAGIEAHDAVVELVEQVEVALLIGGERLRPVMSTSSLASTMPTALAPVPLVNWRMTKSAACAVPVNAARQTAKPRQAFQFRCDIFRCDMMKSPVQ